MTKAIEVTLGGRKFRQILKSTVEHDLWMMDQIRSSGVDSVTMEVSERPEEFAERLLKQFVKTGMLVKVLAGSLIAAEQEDLNWTPEMADELAGFFGKLSDPVDKDTLFGMTAHMVAGFFEQGVVSLMTSLKSSSASPRGPLPGMSSAQDAAH